MSDTSIAEDPRGALRGADHDRGLQSLRVGVVDVVRPAGSLLRVTAQLPAQADLAPWLRANTAVRIALGATFGDVSRIYTVRSVDPAAGRFVFDVVLHASPGPMLAWVAALQPGDTFTLTGPRPHLQVPHRQGASALLFADQSAIPALYALLQQWPEGLCAEAWIASDDPLPVAELPAVAGVVLHRIEAPSPAAPTPLLRTARARSTSAASVVWAAGEREEMRELRRHFLHDIGLDRADVAVAGYWKRGETASETDQRRRRNYERVLARGGGLQDVDDLAEDI
ncbi:siderophore-interacting protein [Stenotrophomonas maltophilia]|nr:siderophore-interacting protein [Stenotrophomonas maltophilia]